MVAVHGGDALHVGKKGDGLDDVAGHFDGDAGDDAVFVNNLGTIGLDSAQEGPLADFRVIHNDKVGRRNEFNILFKKDFLTG